MENYRKEIEDAATSKERKKELENEVQERQAEMQAKQKVIVSIESKLQGVDCENEGKKYKPMPQFFFIAKLGANQEILIIIIVCACACHMILDNQSP